MELKAAISSVECVYIEIQGKISRNQVLYIFFINFVFNIVSNNFLAVVVKSRVLHTGLKPIITRFLFTPSLKLGSKTTSL